MAGAADLVADGRSEIYFNATGGAELRGDRVGAGIGLGSFVGDRDGGFVLQLDAMLHSRRARRGQLAWFAGGGLTTLPEGSAVHVKAGFDRWRYRLGMRAETELLRRVRGNDGWGAIGRVGVMFR